MLKRKLDAQEEMHSILINDRIHFKPNSTSVVEESEPALDKIAQILHDNPDINVHVEGHVAVPERSAETQRKCARQKGCLRNVQSLLQKNYIPWNRGLPVKSCGIRGTRPSLQVKTQKEWKLM